MTSVATARPALFRGKRLRATRRRTAIRSVAYHAFMIGFAFVMLYPLLWLLASSLKGPAEIWTRISSLVPTAPTLENYVHGWAGFGGVTFATFYKNSFLYAGIGTILTIGSSAVVAFGFARIRFAGRRFWFAAMLSTLLLPVQVQIIPQYIVFTKLGWLNTFLPLLLPRFGGQGFSFS